MLAALACGVPGALTIFAFPIHSAPELHDLTALLYMMGHFFLLPVLKMKAPYRVGFGVSLAAVFCLGFYAQAKFPEYGVTVEQKLLVGGPALALKERAALASPIAAEVFAVELAFMVCEHLLFVFFVSGVTSALPKRKLR